MPEKPISMRVALLVAVATARGGPTSRSDLLTLPLVLAQPLHSSPRWIITKNKELHLCRDRFWRILNCDFYLAGKQQLVRLPCGRKDKRLLSLICPADNDRALTKTRRCNLRLTLKRRSSRDIHHQKLSLSTNQMNVKVVLWYCYCTVCTHMQRKSSVDRCRINHGDLLLIFMEMCVEYKLQ